MRYKHIFSAVVLTLSLCACSDKASGKPLNLDENFQSSVTITQNEKDFTAQITKGGADIWKYEFTQPETISGMTLTATGDTCKVDFMGLSYATECENLSETSMVFLTSSVIDKLIAKSDITCTSENDKLYESGTVSGHDFTAEFEDGKLVSLDISDEIHCKFA